MKLPKISNVHILIGLVAVIAVLVIAFIISNGGESAPVSNKATIDANYQDAPDEKAEKALLEMEKQKLVAELNKSVKPNYMKITEWKDFDKFGTYSDKSVTFFALEFAPDLNEQAVADYDIRILKGSEDEKEFASKSELYKEKTKNVLVNMLKNGTSSKLLKTGVVGTIKRVGKNEYKIDFLGDYVYDKFGSTKNVSATTAGKLALIRDYLNFGSIYLTKQESDFVTLIDGVSKDLKDPQFDSLMENVKKFITKK